MAIQGEPDAELEDLLGEIETIQRAAMKPIRAGIIGGEIYAAAAPLGLTGAPSAEELRRALDGKELASGTLVGTYQR